MSNAKSIMCKATGRHRLKRTSEPLGAFWLITGVKWWGRQYVAVRLQRELFCEDGKTKWEDVEIA